MSLLKKAVAWILLFFMSSGIMIGYAALTDNLFIYGEGEIQAKPFVGVYIYDASVYSVNGASSVSFDYFKPTNFSTAVSAPRANTSITYKITVHNNSEVTYWYVKQDYLDEFESNSLIGANGGISVVTKDHPDDTVDTFNNEDWIPPDTYRDFYVTYTFGSGAVGYPSTLINFLFGVKMDSVHDKFLTVLNDQTSGGGYEMLAAAFDEKYRETGSTVIANIGEEKALFDTLFGEELTINVDGVDVPVTVMVQRENVDNRTTGDAYSGGSPSGCEYTVYITVDPLDSPTGEALVYAVSYSSGGVGGEGSQWYQLGQLYEGKADVIDYDTGTAGMQGAFDIDSWIATPNRYAVSDGITYLVGQEQGDQYDKLKTLKEIMSTNDQDIFNEIDNTRILKKVYDIINNPSNLNKPGLDNLRQAFYNAAPFYNIMNNGQEIKVKRNCTRAEIIPYILDIQTALDYYNEVNS